MSSSNFFLASSCILSYFFFSASPIAPSCLHRTFSWLPLASSRTFSSRRLQLLLHVFIELFLGFLLHPLVLFLLGVSNCSFMSSSNFFLASSCILSYFFFSASPIALHSSPHFLETSVMEAPGFFSLTAALPTSFIHRKYAD